MEGNGINIKKELKMKGIEVNGSPTKISRQRIRKIDREYKSIDFSKECALSPHTRLVYRPSDSDKLYLSVNHNAKNIE